MSAALSTLAATVVRHPDPRPPRVHRPYPGLTGWMPRNGGQSIPPAAIGEYLQRLTWQFAGIDEGDLP